VKKYYIYFLGLSTFFMSYSCAVKDKNKTSSDSKLLSDLENYALKVDSAWTEMMKSDDLKMSNMDRLVEELKLIEGSSAISLNALSLDVKNLKSYRYRISSIKEDGIIDRYDSITDKVYLTLKAEINRNPKTIKYQIIHLLSSEIQLADDSVLLYRKNYDKQVDSYNSFVKRNRKNLESNSSQSKLVKYSLFRLVP